MSTDNPNDLLSEQISKKLLEKSLIDPSSEKKFKMGIGTGAYKESDWKTLLEEVINKPKPVSDETKKATD